MDTLRDNSGSLAGLWRPTEREQKAYTYMLSLVDTNKEGIVRGQQAVPFFQKSGLPDAALGNIWQQADADSKGHLTAHEFCVAMKLISLAQAHRTADLRSLKDEVQLPDLKGVDLSRFAGVASALPPSIGSMASASFTYGSGTHARRDSNTSSVGWATAMGGYAADESDAVISAKEKQQYQQLFEKSGPVDGAISGAAARALFTKSKLSNEQLGSVWSLGDPHGEGKLRLPGFLVAMYYIRRIMENRSYVLPKTCPVGLWRSAGGDVPLRAALGGGNFSQSSLLGASTADLTLGNVQWDVSPEERVQYEQYFNSLDTDKVGYLTGDVPVNFFLKSKLSETILSKVWDLADIDRNGRMTKDEFAVAMHLINARLAGTPVPDTLPPTLVPPSMRRAPLTSMSTHNLSPALRPSSARDRRPMDSVKRVTTYAARTPSVAGASTRSPGRLSPVADDTNSVSALQAQLSHMEDVSRGLQTQRTSTANSIALAGAQRQELEVKLVALQSSHDAETRVNKELQETLKAEEARVAALQAQVGEASRVLSVVAAQRGQLEQDVHRVQAQQLALQQKLRQAQDDARQLAAEVTALDQQKKQLTLDIAETEGRIKQQEEERKLLALNAEALGAECDDLTQTQTQLQEQSQSLAQSLAASQPRSAGDTGVPSFDDVFGTAGESPVFSPNDASFGDMFQSISLPQTQQLSAEDKSATTTAAPIPITSQKSQPQQQAASPASVFANMPSLDPSQAATSANAFDAFGAHEKDPFEEFLQAATSPNPDKQQQQQQISGDGSFDAIFGEATSAGRGASADPRSVSSTPAPSSAAYAAVAAATLANGTPSPALPSTSAAKSTPTSPQAVAKSSSAAQALDFTADFNSAFGMLPGANERAIKKDIEEFDAHFPDIGTLSLAQENAQSAATAASRLAAQNPDEDLTFESVFGTAEQSAAPAAPVAKDSAAANIDTAAEDAAKATKSATSDEPKPNEPPKTARKDSSSSEDDTYDDNFVPPPVVKRTNVGVRPMSRVLSIFRSSSSNRTSSMSGGSAPAMPRRATAEEKRLQMSREQDKKFEEQWAKGDWPDWVRKGEHTYERRTLLEMGYPKDRVVEALEVNDFNLAQATDYLLSS